MKNLYKIDDELYIISNTENVNENCWIITDGKLVQVSYLLSNEVAKGNKIILTTNKLLIKDGVQAIDDEFLEWFVKNPNCEEVEVTKVDTFKKTNEVYVDEITGGNYYEIIKHNKIIIPKEEPTVLEEAKQRAANYMSLKGALEFKQETSEEAAELYAEPYRCPATNENEYCKHDIISAFNNGAKWQQERMYSEEEVLEILFELSCNSDTDKEEVEEWFEQFKKKQDE
jgi:hypothetical protein